MASAGCAMTPLQQVRTSIVLRSSSDGLELVTRLSLGPNAEHRQLQIGIKESPVHVAMGHLAHYRLLCNVLYKPTTTTTLLSDIV